MKTNFDKYLYQYDPLHNATGSKSIRFDIKMFNMITEQSDLIASGIFGSWDGVWVSGKPQLVAFARVGSELWLYADGYNQIHKIQMLEGIVPLYGAVAGYAAASKGADVSIAGSISDIYLYYE
jgi:hypothetical protein